ncbi:MAG: riboflavin kinase [Candidatus Magasanikbacteria bacterium]|nr:riboflavin kinase [Candidatus Magasanikbacteria bacterium]
MKIVSGVVVEGRKKGRELGFPTANIILLEKMEGGIYAGKTIISDKEYIGAIFVYPGGDLFEVHLLDFDGDLYGQALKVEVGEKIRDSKQFDNAEDLKAQIAADIAHIKNLSV